MKSEVAAPFESPEDIFENSGSSRRTPSMAEAAGVRAGAFADGATELTAEIFADAAGSSAAA
jgi:hypothetical protein